MGIIIIWLISVLISIVVLYWIISSAINSSELARDMREIKELLKKQNANAQEVSMNKSARSIKQANDSDNSDEPFLEECPACGEQVLSTDPTCRSCGLTLIMKDPEK